MKAAAKTTSLMTITFSMQGIIREARGFLKEKRSGVERAPAVICGNGAGTERRIPNSKL
jgi:hypothetical protein